MGKIALHWQIIIGIILGVVWAYIAGMIGAEEFTLNWIDPWGTIFIRLLKMIAVPLVLFSIIKGVASIADGSRLGRMGLKTLTAYLLSTLFAVTVGLSLVNIIAPGERVDDELRTCNRVAYEQWVEAGEEIQYKDDVRLLTSLSASELAECKSTEGGDKGDFEAKAKSKVAAAEKEKGKSPLQFIVDLVPSNVVYSISDGNGKSQMLQIIFFAILFGMILLKIPDEKSNPVLAVVDGINEVFIKMVDWIMRAAPFFVFALMAGQLAKMQGDVGEILSSLLVYSLVVVAGLAIMIFVIYPTLVIIFTKRKISYLNFFRSISAAQLLAFSTSSSAATLPVTLDCVRDNLGVSRNVTDFVLPIGATVNMDGTSLYQAVAVIFLAQFHMIDLGLTDQLIIVLTATLASIGAAAVPSAGLIMLIMVLGAVDLNPMWIAFIFPIDRILDMCRTVVNVTGDATVSAIIAESEGELNFDPNTDFENFQV